MNTVEHKSVGDAVAVKKRENPYIAIGKDTISLTLMSFDEGIPEPIDNLQLTLGDIVAMPDYFTDPEWNMKLNLRPCHHYSSSEDFGKELIRKEVTEAEVNALMGALRDLANPKRKRSSIDTVFKIANATYFPVKSINGIIQLLMYMLRVKHFDKKLDKNQTHFTPWSVRVYTIGHMMALDYAETAYQLKMRAVKPGFRTENPLFLKVLNHLADRGKLNQSMLEDYAHRFHVMSLQIEMYTAHYLSDHFAAGHMSQVGDLRVVMPNLFGILGGIAVNTMHNELNRIGVLTRKPYDPTPDKTDPPLDAFGDDDFDRCANTFNREACIKSMQNSVGDIENVLTGKERPDPEDYGALSFLPDVDFNVRQPEPMFLLHNDKIFVRGNLSKIRMIGPDDYEQLQKDPKSWGYKQIKGRLHLLYLIFKLRVLPFYKTSEVPLTSEQKERIKQQEIKRNKDRDPMPTPPCEIEIKIVPEPKFRQEVYFERGGSPYLNIAKEKEVEEPNEVELVANYH